MTDDHAATSSISASYRETQTERVLTFTRKGDTGANGDGADGSNGGRGDVGTSEGGDGDEPTDADDVVSIAQNREGYAMLAVRHDGQERERYYGFEMALDHAGAILGVEPASLPIPAGATDMGM